MKAIKKSDGEEVEVRLLQPCEYIAIEPDTVGYAVFRADDLIIDEPVDWSSFRREAAKDILCSILSTKDGADPRDVTIAIGIADELIKQLKNESGQIQLHQATKE